VKKNKHRFLNLLAKVNRSTEKYHSLLKRALAVIIGLLYLQLTDHANVPLAVDIIIFMQGFPETSKLFQGFLQGTKIEKGCSTFLFWRCLVQIFLGQSSGSHTYFCDSLPSSQTNAEKLTTFVSFHPYPRRDSNPRSQ
jgi:hypothetical protein